MDQAADFESWIRIFTFLPIIACSIVGSGVTAAKWLQLRRARIAGDGVLLQVHPLLRAREYDRVRSLVHGSRSFAARLIEQSLTMAGASRAKLSGHVEQVGRQLAREVEYGIGAIALIAGLGPMLGLFGTVVGIVLVFERLAATQGVVSPSQLAGGIGTALYTTIFGLIVGMFGLVSHRFLTALAEGQIGRLEAVGEMVVDLLEEPGS